jgi:2-dehydro-3-deoxyphosphooctonate aldolase (KDO 8-P synthase)
MRSAPIALLLAAGCIASAQVAVPRRSTQQGPQQGSEPGAFQISVEVALVVLQATIRDRQGHAVPQLKREDFEVFEDGKLQPIRVFRHEDTPLAEVAAVVDVLQTPAFLCRQTNFIVAAASQGKPVNIKKGQFLSPWEMQNVVDKARSTGNAQIMVCERGFSFGYNNLVSDMRSLAIMRGTGCPVVFDATHSVQLPGGKGDVSGGQREFVPVLARAAVAAGVAGIFMETHPDPAKALSDGPNAWPLDRMASLLATLKELDSAVKKQPFEESLL